MKHTHSLLRYSVLALAASAVMACNDSNNPPLVAPPAPPVVTPDTYVLTSGNKLVGFAASAPANTLAVNIAVPASETLLGGDFRPADSSYYIVTRVTADNSVKVYPFNISTGVLGTAIPLLSNGMGGGVASLAAGTPITLTGSKVGVDFNPLANALRIVDNTGVNLRTGLGASPAGSGNTFVDAPNAAGINESAYTNSFGSTCQTDLYHLTNTQLLLAAVPNGVSGNPAAGGRLVGSLGVTADANSGFDIRSTASGNVMTAALNVGGVYGLYTINPMTGAATSQGAIGGLGSDTVLGLIANQPTTAPANQAGNMVAITAGTSPALNTFNKAPQGSPARLCSTTPITGLASGDSIVGADSRPSGGALVALTNTSAGVGKLYSIAGSGAATLLSTLAADATDTADGNAAYTSLNGANFAVDFNPIPDRLRVVSDTGQNLRINVTTGATITDISLTTAGDTVTPRAGVSAAAYTNSIFDGGSAQVTQSTALYAIDSSTDQLLLIGADPAAGGACTAGTANNAANPNCGVVTTVGALGVDISAGNGFEIDPITGTALLAATAGANTTLYSVNLGTGAATAAGNFAGPLVALTSNGGVAATVFAVTTSNKLVSFLPDTPGTVTANGTLDVPAGETVEGIDFRPSAGPRNGTLVALTTAAGGVAKVYAVDPSTAKTTLLSTLSANSTDTTAPYTAAVGTRFGIDFNPLPDALRTVSNSNQNLRSNPDSGATFTDGDLSASGVFGAGYTNSFTSTSSTQLFYLADVASGNSTLQGTTAPNNGTLATVGTDLGADYTDLGDLDIVGGQNGFALAALQTTAGALSGLYRISLTAGTATKVGDIDVTTAAGGVESVRGIAIRLQ